MISELASILDEIDYENRATARYLDSIPADRLDWKPHPKSMSLGQLAFHIAMIPSGLMMGLSQDGLPVESLDFSNFPKPKNKDEILATFENGSTQMRKIAEGWSDDQARGTWKFTKSGQPVASFPRFVGVKNLILHHLIHHRAQLGVYLRLLEVPVPAAYGDSADDHLLG